MCTSSGLNPSISNVRSKISALSENGLKIGIWEKNELIYRNPDKIRDPSPNLGAIRIKPVQNNPDKMGVLRT